MHQVVLDRFREVEGHHDTAFADMQFTEHAQLPNSPGLPGRQQVQTKPGLKTTTVLVVIEYTTISV
jgi:hypothetical protein